MRCGYYNQNGCHMYIHGSFLWVLIFPIFAVFVFECILLANVRASINGTTELIGGHTVSWPEVTRHVQVVFQVKTPSSWSLRQYLTFFLRDRKQPPVPQQAHSLQQNPSIPNKDTALIRLLFGPKVFEIDVLLYSVVVPSPTAISGGEGETSVAQGMDAKRVRVCILSASSTYLECHKLTRSSQAPTRT